MAKPATRQQLIDYCFRKLGAPVLEINVDDDQVDDLVDDAIQLYNERHFDGVERMYLKYKITQGDIDRALGVEIPGETTVNGTTGVGIVTTTTTSTNISGYGTTSTNWYENSNFLQIPDSVVGVNKIFKFDTSSISGSMFSIKYQLFLNDLYYFNSVELLQYSMTKTRLEDIDFLLTPEAQIRFNQVYNDYFVKLYLTALIKRQWGQNLIKFRGVKLPGGLELNGREIYDDAERDLEKIKEKMMLEYELPPLDFIG